MLEKPSGSFLPGYVKQINANYFLVLPLCLSLVAYHPLNRKYLDTYSHWTGYAMFMVERGLPCKTLAIVHLFLFHLHYASNLSSDNQYLSTVLTGSKSVREPLKII